MNVRIQFDVAEDQWEEMKTLMDRCGMETRKELFNNAWALLDWAVRERAQGNVIASINDRTNKIKELEMPIFRRISSTSNLTKAN
ncbi:hypothetical protein [Burkholderia ubonensis]|uniref:hypothetical protein n=1 Tax=Burkholderia ubonensis TaxID=101571 RepID=UPI000A8F9A5B|nr:hypothetical protein [Burkholderia ubonensis]